MSNDEHQTLHERKASAGQAIRIVIWIAVLAAIVVFALVNTDDANVDWVFSDATAPMWAVIGISAAAGAIIGFVARPRRRHH